ncbi:MAG: hypothetical protein HQK51_03900 [Oligoflexia bacterium]|nr:hypothetical protein [Oligoflexia bacterium]
MQRTKVAGLALNSGKNEITFLCLFEYFTIDDRWFLTNITELNENSEEFFDVIINHSIKNIIVDFPLSLPACQKCNLPCPGHKKCIDTNILLVRQEIDNLLLTDKEKNDKSPKKYEEDRVNDNLIDIHRDQLIKKSSDYLLSKPFKRKLRKGIIPYWNRTLDFYLWLNYYDPMLNIFNLVYDSYANSSLMKQFKHLYWKKFHPNDLMMYESNVYIILIELLRNKTISSLNLKKINSANIHDANSARESIIDSISMKLNVFIYETDKEILMKNPKAFQSFILGLAGRFINNNNNNNNDNNNNKNKNQLNKLPSWAENDLCNFIVPS